MPIEVSVGMKIPVEGKSPLMIREIKENRIIAVQTRPAVNEKDLLEIFDESELFTGNTIVLPSGISVELTTKRPSGYWENIVANHPIELSLEKVEEMLADHNAALVAHTVSKRCEENPRRLRFMPRKTERDENE